MKFTLLLLGFFAAAPLWATQVEVNCFAKAYVCTTTQNGYTCAWQTRPPGLDATVDLVRDPNYPNPDFPYQVFRARYEATVDNHHLTLDFFYSDHDQTHPLKIYANLNARTVMAESSGSDRIDIALRNQNYGRGFICTSRVIE